MVEVRSRLAVGLTLALLVTLLLAAVVATSAAVTIELSDGDRCETGGAADLPSTPSAENVTAVAGNVTKCLAAGDDDGAHNRQLRPGQGLPVEPGSA